MTPVPIRPAPKPEKPERSTAATRSYMNLVAQLACCCCGRFAVQLHHPIHGRFAQRKSSDMDVIPMCISCHDELHQNPARWRALYGLDTDYTAAIQAAVAKIRRETIGGRT